MSEEETYSREELFFLKLDESPSKGPLCPNCRTHIPRFKDLKPEDEERLKINKENRLRAMLELQRLTGCPLGWAKIWSLHPGSPENPLETAPCPYCGMPLRTDAARQCRYCKRDWHDPDNVIFLPSR